MECLVIMICNWDLFKHTSFQENDCHNNELFLIVHYFIRSIRTFFLFAYDKKLLKEIIIRIWNQNNFLFLNHLNPWRSFENSKYWHYCVFIWEQNIFLKYCRKSVSLGKAAYAYKSTFFKGLEQTPRKYLERELGKITWSRSSTTIFDGDL